jgi:LacI family gluconate utilization system Gnt-I transcriptional repressor
MNQKSTLADVAQESGVSAITVSRYLRSPEKVAVPTGEKIKAAIDKLGYVPNLAAQALASSSSKVIGVLIPSLSNAVFSDVVTGLYDALQGTHYNIQFAHTSYSEKDEEHAIRMFRAQNPAALIIAGVDQSKITRQLLEDFNCPIVQIMDMCDEPVDSIIGFSHFHAAKDAVEKLIHLGHQSIAFMGARMDPRTQKRLSGYREAMTQAGLLDEQLISTNQNHSSMALGAVMLSDLLDKQSKFDAVFCNNDDLAIGALFECNRRGIKVPEDLGICGFNNFAMSEAAHPKVSTVETHRYEMGKKAGEHLLQRFNKPSTAPVKLDLGFNFLHRESL